MATSNSNTHIGRFIDVGGEPRKVLQPLEGYQSLPLVSLEEAIEPIVEFCPDVRRRAYISKCNCESPNDGLSEDEAASIHLYTSEWNPQEQCLYVVLNSVLRSQNRRKLIPPWLLFIKLLLTALYKLKSCTMTVWRGVPLDLRKQYEVGKTYTWWGFSSCTESISVLESDQFLGGEGHRTMFSIECFHGKKIRQYSSIESEDEILLLPASQFVVKSHLQPSKKDPDLVIIHLQQVEPRFPLLEWPPSKDLPLEKKTNDPSPVSSKPTATKINPSNPTYEPPPPPSTNTKPRNDQFVNGGASKSRYCRGRLCTNCGKCRDWYFTGDRQTWNWVRNHNNWNGKDWKTYYDNRVYEHFKRRDDASCFGDGIGINDHCLCENNICP